MNYISAHTTLRRNLCIVRTLALAFPNRCLSGAFLSLVEACLESLSLNFLQERETLTALVLASVLIPLVTWFIHPAFVSILSAVAPAS